jgi:hypothetical protein
MQEDGYYYPKEVRMSYASRNKKEAQLVEWSGCLWIVVLTVVIGAAVYTSFWPFIHAFADMGISFSNLISGMY